MVTVTSELKIKRKPGYLYYLGKDGYIWGSPTKNNKTGKKYRADDYKIKREKGEFWYILKDGTLCMRKR
jgi:hypothetical protein